MERIAILTETFTPETNGVAMTLGRLTEKLRKKGFSVAVIRPAAKNERMGEWKGEFGRELRVPGMSVPGYPQIRVGLAFPGTVERFLVSNKISRLYIATEGPLGATGLLAARKSGIRVWSGFHTNFGLYCEKYGLGILKKPTEAWLSFFHNGTIGSLSPSEDSDEEAKGMGIRNTVRMGRGVDSELFNPSRRDEGWRKSLGIDEDTVTLLSVGRLAKEKGLDLAVNVHKEAQRRGLKTKLVFVGEGPEERRLRGSCPDALFTGPLFGEELARAYASGDLFLFPSETETYGNVIMEAAASGVSSCAFNMAAAREKLTGAARLYEKGDWSGFIKGAADLAGNGKERELLAREALSRIPQNGWEDVVNDFLTIIDAQKEMGN